MDTCFTTQQNRLEETVFHAMQTRFWVGLSSSSSTPARGVSGGARDPGLTYQALQTLAIAIGPMVEAWPKLSASFPTLQCGVPGVRTLPSGSQRREDWGLLVTLVPVTWRKETQPQTSSDETQRAHGGE